MSYRSIVLVFIIVGLMISPSAAQVMVNIEPGEIKQGEITDSFFNQRYRFQAEAGETYIIRMERVEAEENTLDPLLFLFDANEQFIEENDDIEDGSRNAQITFTPPGAGVYIIEATRFQQEAGTTAGAFRLVLQLASDLIPETPERDPLSTQPEFGVPFTVMEYSVVSEGTLTAEASHQYFTLGGRQGDVFQLRVRAESGDLVPAVAIPNPDFPVPELRSTTEDGTEVIHGIFPQTGWYLIEVTAQSGSGNFFLLATLQRDGLLIAETPLQADFTEAASTQFFVLNATINERVFVNMTVLSDEEFAATNVVPKLAIIDRSGQVLDERESSGNQTRVSITIPRSGPYILRADNLGTEPGRFRLEMRRNDPNINKLRVQTAEYNENYSGTINDDNPIDYYRFKGKAGELVSVQMQPSDERETLLDPFLILTDSNLTELAFNDNTGATRTARIAQFSLPVDGDYFILATRPRLSLGGGGGNYEMSLTVGQIALQGGSLTATLEWVGDADLNLFVRAPSGRTVSWANPTIQDGGTLQIDSNTGCETPTAQPVEHIFWPEGAIEAGDYTVWVWYQNVCSSREPITFTLTLAVHDEPLFIATSTPQNPLLLSPDERFETGIRISDTGSAGVTNRGTITTPSPQQAASQGGDKLIVYGQTLTGTITNEVFAQFYQFRGNAGDTITIQVQRLTGNLDPVVVLRDSLENNLATNDDTDNTRNAALSFKLTESGRHIIAVTRFGVRDGTTVGDYNLTLVRE